MSSYFSEESKLDERDADQVKWAKEILQYAESQRHSETTKVQSRYTNFIGA